MFDRKEATIWDVLDARSASEVWSILTDLKADPVWLIAILLLAGVVYFRYMAYSPLDKREARPGSHYLGNVNLEQNPKADSNGPLRTRLHGDPDYIPDDPVVKTRRRRWR